MVLLVVLPSVVALVLHEEVLIRAVAGESDRRDPEPGKGALEAIEAGEDALESPGLAVVRWGVEIMLAGCMRSSSIDD